MSRTKRILLFTLPAVLLLLMGQGTGPTVFTPRLTVQPGPLTVTTGDTNVQDLFVNGTCFGCGGVTVPSDDGAVLRSDGAGGIKVNGDASIVSDDLTVGGQIISTTGGFVAPDTGVAGTAYGFANDPELGLSRSAADQLQLQASAGVFIRADWPDGITIGGTGGTTIPVTHTGTTTLAGAVAFTSGGITMSSCDVTIPDGTVNDFDVFANCSPSGPAAIVRMTSAAGSTLNGIVLPSNQWVVMTNVGSTNIIFNNQNASSSATNRFIQSQTNCTYGSNRQAILWKDPTTDRVRPMGFLLGLCGA